MKYTRPREAGQILFPRTIGVNRKVRVVLKLERREKTAQWRSWWGRLSNTQEASEPFGKLCTLLLFSAGYKSLDLIRSAPKRSVLIVQPLQFHYSIGDHAPEPLKAADLFKGRTAKLPQIPLLWLA
jgi:hypothetical protein